MALMQCSIFSRVLGLSVALNVIYPEPATAESPPPKVLYLLHGLSDNAGCWGRYSMVEILVQGLGLAVVMPEVHRSFYTDMKHGSAYFRFIAEELPYLCDSIFRIGTGQENTFVAGLSMGGYGATKLALTYPDRFAACGSFSGVIDPRGCRSRGLMSSDEATAIWGAEDELQPENDLLELSKWAANIGCTTKFYRTCGTSDFLYEDNQAFYTAFRALPLESTLECWDGAHSWSFWNESLQRFLSFIQK